MLSLFDTPQPEVQLDIETRVADAIEVIADLFRIGHVAAVGVSGGKDSAAVMVLAFLAAERAKSEGVAPRIVVTHADTGVESPVIVAHARSEIDKIRAYAAKIGVDVQVIITQPSLASSWALRVIGGRAMPSFPESNSDCSTDWKIIPMIKARKALLANAIETTGKEAVTLTGSRFSESIARGARMRKRGDSASTPVRNKLGELVLTPIADFTDERSGSFWATSRLGCTSPTRTARRPEFFTPMLARRVVRSSTTRSPRATRVRAAVVAPEWGAGPAVRSRMTSRWKISSKRIRKPMGTSRDCIVFASSWSTSSTT